MAKQSRNTARNASVDSAVESFNVAAWRADLVTAFTDYASAATKALHVVLEGRGKVEPDTAREAITEAFIAAGAVENSPSLKNRVAEAMCIFNAESLPNSLPSNLQHAAKAVREHKKATGESKARQPRQPNPSKAGDPAPLKALADAVEGVRSMEGLSQVALDLVSDLADLVNDLAEAILKPAE